MLNIEDHQSQFFSHYVPMSSSLKSKLMLDSLNYSHLELVLRQGISFMKTPSHHGPTRFNLTLSSSPLIQEVQISTSLLNFRVAEDDLILYPIILNNHYFSIIYFCKICKRVNCKQNRYFENYIINNL